MRVSRITMLKALLQCAFGAFHTPVELYWYARTTFTLLAACSFSDGRVGDFPPYDFFAGLHVYYFAAEHVAAEGPDTLQQWAVDFGSSDAYLEDHGT